MTPPDGPAGGGWSERLDALRTERARAAAGGDFTMPRSLRSGRIFLGQPGPDHLDPFVRFWTDPDSTRFIGGPRDRLGAWRMLASACGAWVIQGFGPYAMQLNADGSFIGYCGVWFPADMPELEIAFGLVPDARGHGYAVEAVVAVVEEAVRRGAPSLVSIIHPDDEASQHVAAGAGASCDRILSRDGAVQQLWRYRVPADEALARSLAEVA